MSEMKLQEQPKTRSAEKSSVTREEKIQEILEILGDLYQRVGYHQASPANLGLSQPDFRYVGYQPYPTQSVQAWTRQQTVPGMMLAMEPVPGIRLTPY